MSNTMNLQFSASARVIFGCGTFERVGEAAGKFGYKVAVIADAGVRQATSAIEQLEAAFKAKMLEAAYFDVEGEPTVAAVQTMAEKAAGREPNAIVAVGGGSAIDAAKLVGGVLANGGTLDDYLSKPGGARAFARPSIPVVAIPTTAGAGAEATQTAEVIARCGEFKHAVRSAMLRPTQTLIDPELGATPAPELKAACGLSVLARLIESFTSRRAGILTDGFVREGLNLCARWLPAMRHGDDSPEAREGMAMAALLSGLAGDNAGLGAIHALASAVGAAAGIPYAAVCANLLPEIVEANVTALNLEEDGARKLDRYRELAESFGEGGDRFEDLTAALRGLRRGLNIAPLYECGFCERHVAPALQHARTATAMTTNPVYLDHAHLNDILTRLAQPETLSDAV